MDMYLLEADISNTNVKSNKKKYKCPYCEARIERAKLYLHIQDEHEDLIPEGYTALRVAFNSVNNKTCGYCIICKKETDWNETKGRYERLCNNPGCHEAYKRIVAERNQRIYGTDRLQSDPRYADFVQRKALEGRKMFGKYKFADGGEIAYLGSYERKLLVFLNDVMECKSEDILAPGPSIVYKYEGVEHTYIPDFYYIPYNLIIEVKDGGTNPNTHPKRMGADRERIHAKEQAVIDERKFNYVRVTNNNFGQLMSVMAALKFSYYYTSIPEEDYIVRANESALLESATTKFNSPEELFNYMSKNFKYHDSNDFSYSWKDLFKTKEGNCYDQANFELHFLREMGYKCGGCYAAEFTDWTKKEPDFATHAWVWFIDNKNKYFWFENAWEQYRGIHGPFNSVEDINKHIASKWSGSGKYKYLYITTLSSKVHPGMSNSEYSDAHDPSGSTPPKSKTYIIGSGKTVNESVLTESGNIKDNSMLRSIVNRIHSKYESDKKDPVGNQNCQLCTWCAESQMRGINVLPRPIYSPRDKVFNLDGLDIVKRSSRIKISSVSDVEDTILKYPNSRFYAHVKWKNGHGGHEFLVVNIDNAVFVADPQAGIIDKIGSGKGKEYFSSADFSESFIARMDDKEINKDILEYNDTKYLTEWDPKLDIPYMLKHGMISKEEADKEMKKINEITEDMSGTIAAALAPNPIPHEADKDNYYIVQHPQNNVFAYGITKDPGQSIIYSVDPEEKGFYKAFKTKKGDIEKKYLTFKIKDSQTARELYDELALMEKTGAKVFDESVTSSEFIYRRLTEGSEILSPEQLLFDTRFELVKNPETELQEMCDNLYKWLKARPIDVLEEQVALLEDYYTDGLTDYNVLPDNIDNLEDLKKWKNRYDSMPFETRMRSDDISLDLYKDTNMNRYTKKMASLLDMVDPQKNNPIENLNKNTVMVSDLFRESDDGNMVFRYTYDGKGIYDSLRKAVSAEVWQSLKNSKVFSWLPVPNVYEKDENYRSYFTLMGKEKFDRTVLPIIYKYLDKKHVELESFKYPNEKSIVYKDSYQIVVKGNSKVEAISESEDKSKLDKNFTNKEVYDLSKYRRIVTDNSSGGIKSDLIVWKDGARKVGQVFADIDKASDGNRWFGSLEVSKDYRGHGLSEQILDYIINKYKSNALAVYKDNEIAVNLYKKKGFKIVKNAPNLSNEYYTMIRGSHISESATDSEDAKPDVLNSYEWEAKMEKTKEAEDQGLIIMVHDGRACIDDESDLAAFKEKWNRYQSLPEDKRILSSQTASNIFGLNNENLYTKILNNYINREEFFKNAGGLGKYLYDEDPGSDVSQYFNPGEEADYISSDATVQTESASEREKEKKFEQRMESLENLSMRLRNTTNEVKRKILKQQIKARGWNPEIPYNKEAVRRVNEFKFASYADVEEVEASTLCEAITAMEDIPKERTSESLKDKIVPVFVILSHGTQLHSKGIMWFTDSEWSHASLALDSSLKEMYTFTTNIDNAPNKRHRNGFAIDTVERYMKYDPHMKVKVYALFITPKQREEMRDAIQWYIRHQDDTSYGFKNIMNIFARRMTRRKAKDGDKCKMVCSQFVYTILMLVNFRLRKNKDSSLVSPADIDDLSDDARFYVVYQGGIDEYDSKKVDKICYDLLPSLPVEMYNIQESEGTKMVVNPKSAIGKPNMVNRVLGMADEMLK